MYFDYSASTPISKKALNAYYEASLLLNGNCQSNHHLGRRNIDQIYHDKKEFKQLLDCPNHTLSFTQNASEANRLVIETILHTPDKMRVIMGPFEHQSIVKTLGKLQQNGLKIDVIDTDHTGQINFNHLEDLLKDPCDLLIVSCVDSELGLIQDIHQIRKLSRGTKLLVDITQAIGKVEIDFIDIDFMVFSAHKFYGPKGLGGIFHLDPTFSFENGTLSEALIHSAFVALKETLTNDQSKVFELNQIIKKALGEEPHVSFNNQVHAIAHVINISILTREDIDLIEYFNQQKIYLSKGSACQNSIYSSSVLRLTGSKEKAMTSVRISLSHLTQHNEVYCLIQKIKDLKYL